VAESRSCLVSSSNNFAALWASYNFVIRTFCFTCCRNFIFLNCSCRSVNMSELRNFFCLCIVTANTITVLRTCCIFCSRFINYPIAILVTESFCVSVLGLFAANRALVQCVALSSTCRSNYCVNKFVTCCREYLVSSRHFFAALCALDYLIIWAVSCASSGNNILLCRLACSVSMLCSTEWLFSKCIIAHEIAVVCTNLTFNPFTIWCKIDIFQTAHVLCTWCTAVFVLVKANLNWVLFWYFTGYDEKECNKDSIICAIITCCTCFRISDTIVAAIIHISVYRSEILWFTTITTKSSIGINSTWWSCKWSITVVTFIHTLVVIACCLINRLLICYRSLWLCSISFIICNWGNLSCCCISSCACFVDNSRSNIIRICVFKFKCS